MAESPLTIQSLVDEVQDAAQGYVRGQDIRTSLLNSITDSALTFTVTDGTRMAQGPVEIDDELIQVAAVDSSGVATVEPWGRGLGGSTAAAHSAGARVSISPLYPRQRVRNTIYGILRQIFPDVFAVGTYTLDGSATQTNFVMPSDCYHILRVETKLMGPSLTWQPVGRWRQNKQPTTVELELIGPVVVGSDRVRVQYIKTPVTSFGDTDNLADYGYDYQVRDLVVLGSVAQLMAYTETSRIQTQSMESHGRAESVQVGSAAALSRVMFARFEERVASERMQLLNRYPTQPHSTR